jgi:hypothetical protein
MPVNPKEPPLFAGAGPVLSKKHEPRRAGLENGSAKGKASTVLNDQHSALPDAAGPRV